MSPEVSAGVAEAFDAVPGGHGVIGLLSSDEFLPVAEPFDRALLETTGSRIGLIFAADPRGAEPSARLATAHYRKLGADPFIVDVLIRDDATADKLAADCDVLFMAGGSPAALLATLRDTPFWTEALRRWSEGMALAGSSAGAMALCAHSMVPAPGDRRPSRWEAGLGPISKVALAVHARSASNDWLTMVRETAPVPVVALDEAVGVVLRAGEEPVVAGDGRARLL
jgi:peptidase S51-like protein